MAMVERTARRQHQRRIVGILAAVLISLGLVVGTTATAHADGNGPGKRVTTHGCPAYAFCIYPANAGWNHNRPADYWRFPDKTKHYWINLRGQYGTHRVFNNGLYLWGCGTSWDEDVSLNTGSNGGGKHRWVASGRSYDVNLTPINSVTLWYFYGPNDGTCANG